MDMDSLKVFLVYSALRLIIKFLNYSSHVNCFIAKENSQSWNNPRPITKNYKRNFWRPIMKQSEANHKKLQKKLLQANDKTIWGQ